MAKGLGWMMASAAAEAERLRSAAGEAIACPLCGKETEYNGCVWVCKTAHEFTANQTEAAFAAYKEGQFVRWGEWNPTMQGMIVAAVVTPAGEILGTFETRRGACARTNWLVTTDGNREEFPAAVLQYGWTFQEFMEEK